MREPHGSALRLSCGSNSPQKWTYRLTGHTEKLVCDDTVGIQLYDFVRRSCNLPAKPKLNLPFLKMKNIKSK